MRIPLDLKESNNKSLKNRRKRRNLYPRTKTLINT